MKGSGPIRILVTSGTYPPEIGGPPRYLPPLLARLGERGHGVSVVTFGERVTDHAPVDDWPVLRISRRLPLPLRLPRFALAAARAARRADVVFAVGQAVPSATAARLARRPLLLRIVGDLAWEHTVRRGETDLDLDAFQTAKLPRRAARARRLHRRAVRRADLVLVPGRYLAGVVAGWDVPEERIRVVPNAAPPDAASVPPSREEARQALGIDGRHVLAVGRLVPWKGFHHLVRALGSLPDDVALDVLGEGPEEERLRALADESGVASRVTFRGSVPPERVAAWLAATDVLALPSTYEGLSHVLLEAMDAGCPVVTTRCAGNPEVVRNEVEGLLIDAGDVEGLAVALRRVLEDDALRARLAVGARGRGADYSHDAMVDATEALLIEVARS